MDTDLTNASRVLADVGGRSQGAARVMVQAKVEATMVASRPRRIVPTMTRARARPLGEETLSVWTVDHYTATSVALQHSCEIANRRVLAAMVHTASLLRSMADLPTDLWRSPIMQPMMVCKRRAM